MFKNKESINIVYIIPDTGISGGLAVVLQQANRLKKRGHDVRLISLVGDLDVDWFPKNEVQILKFENRLDLGCVDIVVATHFLTVACVQKISAKRKLYFIQSDERRFEDDNIATFQKCEQTYQTNLEFVTMAKWIQRWLKEEFNKDAYYVPNGLDLDIFHEAVPIEKKSNKIRVLIEGAINIPFKGMDDAYAAVKDLDCEIWIISSNGIPKKSWRYDRFYEKVSMDEMKQIYSSCDILLKMSKVESFCYPPLEMMACGGASVIRAVTGIEEYAIDKVNCLIVSDVTEAKKAVEMLIKNENLRKKLIENGLKTAKEWSWDKSIDLLEKVVRGEKVEVFYTETTPERYDYFSQIKEIIRQSSIKFGELNRLVEESAQRIENLENELHFVTSSKFWKVRGIYLRIKFLLFSPHKFLVKYFKIVAYLLKSFFASVRQEGLLTSLIRIWNYAVYGKGVLDPNKINKDEEYVNLKEVLGKFKKR